MVEDKKNLKLVGVITPHDITHHVAAEDRKASEIPVKDIMKPVSACCGADESVEAARHRMHEHQTTSLPFMYKSGSCCGAVNAHNW